MNDNFTPQLWADEMAKQLVERIDNSILDALRWTPEQAPVMRGLRVFLDTTLMERVAQVEMMVGDDHLRIWFVDGPPLDLDYDDTLKLKEVGASPHIGWDSNDARVLRAKLLLAVNARHTEQ